VALEYFSESELRALPQMSDTIVYTSARIDAAGAWAVTTFEEFCGTAFIPRSYTELFDGSRANRANRGLVLTKRRATAVTALKQDGIAFTAPELLELKLDGGVVKRLPAGSYVPQEWNWGTGNIEATYTYGFAQVPGDVKEAALQATRARLLGTNSNADFDDRRTSMTTEMGTVNFVIAGEDRPTGYPEVDAVLLRYRKSRAPLVF